MGRRQKRRKRKRAEERAEEKQIEKLQEPQVGEVASNDGQSQSSSVFGFSLRRDSEQDNAPQYDDKPWWSTEEEYELDDWEVKQYGAYKAMPPPMKPEHLREPEPTRKERMNAEEKLSRSAAIRARLGRVFGVFRKIDWELTWLRISELGTRIKAGIMHFVDWMRFQNLRLSEKFSLKIRLLIYLLILLLLIGGPLVAGYFTLGMMGSNATESPEPIQTRVVETTLPTQLPQQIIATNTMRPTIPPTPLPTAIPATPIPTSPPAAQPTPVPVQSSGSIASFFAPSVQYWGSDLIQWSQQYTVDVNLLATALQLQTCGNPLYLGADGQLGLFGVPGERYLAGDAFNNPADSARRGAELLIECLELSGGDNGRALVCYHSGPPILQTDFGEWSEEAQKMFLWALGIIGDAQTGASQSAALNDWLVNGGGFDTCNQATAALGG